MGHSGAHRTLRAWLKDSAIDTVVLVDAAYGEIDQYKDWILGNVHRRMIDVGDRQAARGSARDRGARRVSDPGRRHPTRSDACAHPLHQVEPRPHAARDERVLVADDPAHAPREAPRAR